MTFEWTVELAPIEGYNTIKQVDDQYILIDGHTRVHISMLASDLKKKASNEGYELQSFYQIRTQIYACEAWGNNTLDYMFTTYAATESEAVITAYIKIRGWPE